MGYPRGASPAVPKYPRGAPPIPNRHAHMTCACPPQHGQIDSYRIWTHVRGETHPSISHEQASFGDTEHEEGGPRNLTKSRDIVLGKPPGEKRMAGKWRIVAKLYNPNRGTRNIDYIETLIEPAIQPAPRNTTDPPRK